MNKIGSLQQTYRRLIQRAMIYDNYEGSRKHDAMKKLKQLMYVIRNEMHTPEAMFNLLKIYIYTRIFREDYPLKPRYKALFTDFSELRTPLKDYILKCRSEGSRLNPQVALKVMNQLRISEMFISRQSGLFKIAADVGVHFPLLERVNDRRVVHRIVTKVFVGDPHTRYSLILKGLQEKCTEDDKLDFWFIFLPYKLAAKFVIHYCAMDNLESAEQWFAHMEELREGNEELLPSQQAVYINMAQLLFNRKDFSKAVNFFYLHKSKIERASQPSIFSHVLENLARILKENPSSYSESDSLPWKQVLMLVKDLQISVGDRGYAAMFWIHVKDLDVQNAENCLYHLISSEFDKSTWSERFYHLIQLCMIKKDLDKGSEWLTAFEKHMKARNAASDNTDWDRKYLVMAKDFVQQTEDSLWNFTPVPVPFPTNEKPSPARKKQEVIVKEEVVEEARPAPVLKESDYHDLISKCLVADRMDLSERWIKEMIADGFTMTSEISNNLLRSYSKRADLVKCTYWFRKIKGSGTTVEKDTFIDIIRMSTELSGEETTGIWAKDLLESHPTVSTSLTPEDIHVLSEFLKSCRNGSSKAKWSNTFKEFSIPVTAST